MALPITNPGFDVSAEGWTLSGGAAYSATGGLSSPGSIRVSGSVGQLRSNTRGPVVPGQRVTASCMGRMPEGSDGTSFDCILLWYDINNVLLSISDSVELRRFQGSGWRKSTNSATAPANAYYVSVGADGNTAVGGVLFFDDFVWDVVDNRAVVITSPINNNSYDSAAVLPLRVNISGGQASTVSYTATNLANDETIQLGNSASSPFSFNYNEGLLEGTYDIVAVATFGTTQISSAPVRISITSNNEDKEYRASNSYTYLVGENFINLGGAMPPTARVLGVEVLVDYTLEVLVRSKDVGIADPAQANYDVAFAVVDGGTVEAVLLNNDGTAYTQLGAPMSNTLPINRSDFTVTEDGTSEGKRWTVLTGGEGQVVVGGEDQRFGLAPEFGSTFINYGVGIRFTPNLASVPAYADAGDASYRFNVQSFKVRVYFDAGSVEYYFASADKTQVLKGTLAAYYVYTGNFTTNDATGVLQLAPTLEQMDGTQRWIGSDWTIHSSYPPTDINQIGEVGEVDVSPELGMKYNALPTQQQVLNNRSRYEFITENFYGDPDLNSMYGVHGLPRAFAYNGDFFYKIYTQPDAEKDSPRHVANHHGHLALGYYGGRVDISVAGEPYNFSGVDGASSWAFGDKVVGLLPLSGTILGVFGAKSVWGISGTTVDNFATQVISPNMGAVEYTITDMGFPVYANSYGIYTLNQTQQYGDYLGQPMSQDISPWLRPRLIRKLTSDKEVVCAFPVRSKNQYRLCFSDGYVTSMTLNGRQVPTFSFQKYFYTPEGMELPVDIFSYPSIVPAAVSSELDESGEERIHMAPVDSYIPPAPAPAELEAEIGVTPYYYEGGA